MPNRALLFTNLRIVLPGDIIENGALRLREGRIAAIDHALVPIPGERVVDGRGLTAVPGIIDLHGDMIEHEIEPRTGVSFPIDVGIYELDKRMAACGVTTAFAALSFWGLDDNKRNARSQRVVREVINRLNLLRPTLLTDLRVHARYEVSLPGSGGTLLRELLQQDQIQLLSLMDHTPGQGQYRNIERYIEYLMKIRESPRELIEHEARERIAQAQAEAETHWNAAREFAAIAVAHGIPVASHDDDTAEKIALVASMGTSIAEFPVTLEAAQAARERGMHVVMGAPNVLRGGSHSGNLNAQEAIAAGVVDTLAADYAPIALIQAVLRLAADGTCSLPAAVQLITTAPADALGMQDHGRLAVGAAADIALIEDGATPRVRATLRNGTPIYWDADMWWR